jgi:hypothetical protein
MMVTDFARSLGYNSVTAVPEYNIYYMMKRRCLDPKNPKYPDYGGRGIKVCKRWLHPGMGFINFLTDLGRRPPGMWLERKNNNGNYTPRNCAWASPWEQGNNRRNSFNKFRAFKMYLAGKKTKADRGGPRGIAGRHFTLSPPVQLTRLVQGKSKKHEKIKIGLSYY